MVTLTGCVTIDERPTVTWPKERGIYHTAGEGETLWRIAQTYGVSIDQLVSSNKIPNAAHIEEGQLIFIPHAQEQKIIYDTPQPSAFSWPIRGKIISYFGHHTDSGMVNNGIRILAQQGAVVTASRDGRVVFADYLSGFNYTVILDHADGYFTVYGNNGQLLVSVGDNVSRGMEIATVGAPGSISYAHFEIRNAEVADNPLYYLP